MAEVVPLELSADRALQMIRELAAETENIVPTFHVLDKCVERGITRGQINKCVQLGTIQEGPFLNQRGNWQVNLFRHAAGEELTCVVVIDWPSKLLVVTAF